MNRKRLEFISSRTQLLFKTLPELNLGKVFILYFWDGNELTLDWLPGIECNISARNKYTQMQVTGCKDEARAPQEKGSRTHWSETWEFFTACSLAILGVQQNSELGTHQAKDKLQSTLQTWALAHSCSYFLPCPTPWVSLFLTASLSWIPHHYVVLSRADSSVPPCTGCPKVLPWPLSHIPAPRSAVSLGSWGCHQLHPAIFAAPSECRARKLHPAHPRWK